MGYFMFNLNIEDCKSQIGQDVWITKKLNEMDFNPNDFYFVDIGAYDGLHLSNTYAFEKNLGAKGVCVECNPLMIQRFKYNRPNSDLCTKAIYTESGHKLKFSLNDCNSCIDNNGDYEVETISINDLLSSYNATKNITYINLDIEGLEPEILATFDFSKWNVLTWTIEHNHVEANKNKILDILLKHNYMVKLHEWDIFAYKDFLEPIYYVDGVRVK